MQAEETLRNAVITMPISFLLILFIWIQHDWMPVSGQHDRSYLIKFYLSQSTFPDAADVKLEAGKTTMGKKREVENIGYFRCNKLDGILSWKKKKPCVNRVYLNLAEEEWWKNVLGFCDFVAVAD